jgi:hypothetical protein
MTPFNDPQRVQKEVGALLGKGNRGLPGTLQRLVRVAFQKRVVKDAELFAVEDSGRIAEETEPIRERGFADVWKKGCFAWEYKGKKKNLDDAYQQLLRSLRRIAFCRKHDPPSSTLNA